MSENLHDIDKLFRDGMEEYGEMPSGKVWEGVDAGLDKGNVVQMRRKYNNLKRVAAVLLLLLLSVAGYEIFKPKSSGNGNDVATGSNKPSVKKEDNSTVLPNSIEEQSNTSNNPASAQKDNTITNNSNQSNVISNAGFDSVNNTNTATIPKNKTAAPDKKTVSPVMPQDKKVTTDKAITNSVTRQKNASTAVAENGEDKYAVKSSVKKSNQNRTRIKIKSPLPEQPDDARDETANELQAENNNSNSSVTELQPLEKTKAATLAERINRAITAAEDVAVKRSSPGVTVKKIKPSRSFHFSLMPFFSPQYVSNNLKEESHQQWSNTGQGGPPPPRPGRGDHKEQYKDDEQKQSAYNFGVIAEVPLGKKISVQSGITYLNKSTNIEPKKIYAKTDVDGKVKYVFDCSSGYSYLSTKTGTTPAVGDSITATASKNVLGYIGVPLMVNYKFSLGKFNIIPAVGTVFNFLTKQKIQTELVQGSAKEQQTVSKIEGLKSNYVNAVTGLAFEYSFNNKIALNIMPSGNFALSSINNSSAVVKSYPNAFAVSGGIKIKF